MRSELGAKFGFLRDRDVDAMPDQRTVKLRESLQSLYLAIVLAFLPATEGPPRFIDFAGKFAVKISKKQGFYLLGKFLRRERFFTMTK